MRPKQVTAFRSLDGSLWPTEAEAMENDAKRGVEVHRETLNTVRREMSGMGMTQSIEYLLENADKIKEAADYLKGVGYDARPYAKP